MLKYLIMFTDKEKQPRQLIVDAKGYMHARNIAKADSEVVHIEFIIEMSG